MSTAEQIPKIAIKYAWDSPVPFGATYDSPHEARDAEPYSQHLYDLLRLYVDATGRIVHTEVVA